MGAVLSTPLVKCLTECLPGEQQSIRAGGRYAAGNSQLIGTVAESCIDSIIESMSLAEKLGQMMMPDFRVLRPGWSMLGMVHSGFAHTESQPLDDTSAEPVKVHGLGAVLGGGGAAPEPNEPFAWRAQNAALQRAAAATRSRVPLLIGNDSVHGQNNLRGATLFPHHIGQGCMRNESGEPDAARVRELAAVAAVESYACGLNWLFTPCAAVPHDVRWGRTYEGFSEDHEIVAVLAAAEVAGVQGQGFPMAACLKHWVGDGATTFGTGTADFYWSGAPTGVLDQGDAVIDQQALRHYHISAYLPALLSAGCLTVMASYSSWNGEKLHTCRHLVTEVLKNDLGFQGLVVTDYNAVNHLGDDFGASFANCVNAGVDMIMTASGLLGVRNDMPYEEQLQAAEAAVHTGLVSKARLDDAVRRILRVKMAMGLLETSSDDVAPDGRVAYRDDRPVSHGRQSSSAAPRPRAQARPVGPPVDHLELDQCVGCAEHRAIARAAVSSSCVLLSNYRDALPIPSNAALAEAAADVLVVTGAGADDVGMQCGGWSLTWQGQVGNEGFPGATSIWQAIQHSRPDATLLSPQMAALPWPLTPTALTDATTVVVVAGEAPYAEGVGDRREVEISQADVDLIDAVADGTRRVIVVLLCGRPLALPPQTLDKLDALLVAWLPGTEGSGVTDVLFGFVAPTGRLSYAWPSSPQQCTKMHRSRGSALFPLGYGLDMDC